jgi:hypothetical protein|tara:strand:+ start:31 stop:861 length:831 start_codon:yes stop_codon:yes gene_type:complete
MAKKKKKEEAVFDTIDIAKSTAKKETPVKTDAKVSKDNWEIKDRTYYLRDGLSPLTYTINSRGIYWFDEEKGYERELKYTVNQKTPFVDEFKGDAILGHITFNDGVLNVPKEKQTLQKLLSLYHPQKGRLFNEFDPVETAVDELQDIEIEIEALNVAKNLDIDLAEAVLRVEQGNKVSNMTSKEIKRDVLLYAKKNPVLFLELANDDNVQLRNFGIKAVEAGLLKLSADNRTFNWGSNNRKIMTVPFDEHPYSALAAFFKTDEGLEIYKNIEKRLQ